MLGYSFHPRHCSHLPGAVGRETPAQCRAQPESRRWGLCVGSVLLPCWAAACNPDAVPCCKVRPVAHQSHACSGYSSTGRVSSSRNSEELLWGHFPACLRSPHRSAHPAFPEGCRPPCRAGIRVLLLKEHDLAHGLSSRALPMAPIFLLLPLRKRQGDAWCAVGSARETAPQDQGAGKTRVCGTHAPSWPAGLRPAQWV